MRIESNLYTFMPQHACPSPSLSVCSHRGACKRVSRAFLSQCILAEVSYCLSVSAATGSATPTEQTSRNILEKGCRCPFPHYLFTRDHERRVIARWLHSRFCRLTKPLYVTSSAFQALRDAASSESTRLMRYLVLL